MASVAAIATVGLLQLSPTSPLRIRRAPAAPLPAPAQPSQFTAGPTIEMLAPEEVPAEATTTIGFRVLDAAGKVLRQFALPPADTLDITISDAQTALSWSLPATFDEESGTFVALLKLDRPGDYRITAQCNFSGRPPLRQAGSVRVVAIE